MAPEPALSITRHVFLNFERKSGVSSHLSLSGLLKQNIIDLVDCKTTEFVSPGCRGWKSEARVPPCSESCEMPLPACILLEGEGPHS